jgi:hypothetical protein
MPMKLSVGASKKVGEANYGSRGASVNLELELDATLITEPQKLQQKIRHLFAFVRTSLAEELNGGNGRVQAEPAPPTAATPNGNGNGVARSAPQRATGPRLATAAQVKAIYAIARRQELDIATFLKERCNVRRPDDLTIKQASEVIDELKCPSQNGS